MLAEAPRAQLLDHLALVAGQLQVDVELDAGVGLAGEHVEALGERHRLATVCVLMVVREHDAAVG